MRKPQVNIVKKLDFFECMRYLLDSEQITKDEHRSFIDELVNSGMIRQDSHFYAIFSEWDSPVAQKLVENFGDHDDMWISSW